MYEKHFEIWKQDGRSEVSNANVNSKLHFMIQEAARVFEVFHKIFWAVTVSVQGLTLLSFLCLHSAVALRRCSSARDCRVCYSDELFRAALSVSLRNLL